MKLGEKMNINPFQLGMKNGITHSLGIKNLPHKIRFNVDDYFDHEKKKIVSNLEKNN